MKARQTIHKQLLIFNSPALRTSSALFRHFIRIPEVSIRLTKAREILKRYKIQPPAWMFGLLYKGEQPNKAAHLRLMSLIINTGLYDRLIRLKGAPDFLVGTGLDLAVSAKVKTYEKTVVKIFCGMKQNSLKIYKKTQKRPLRFSLLHFSEEIDTSSLYDIINRYQIKRCVFIPSYARNILNKQPENSLKMEGLIEKDPLLNWFRPVLQRKTKAYHKFPGSLNTFFH